MLNPAVYSIFLDGRPVQRGLTQVQAYRQAEYLAREQNRKNASSKQRNPEWEVKLDPQLSRDEEALYQWAKQGG